MDGTAVGYAGQNASNNRTAPPPPSNPSCFGNVEDACSACSGMAQRVERIVARLAGDYPAADAQPDKGTSPNGLFEAADRQAADIRLSMDRIRRAMDILEKSMP